MFYLYTVNEKRKDMTITATKEFSKVVFTWNDDLTECNHVALNVTDKEFELLIDSKVHEGSDLEGWNVDVNF